MDAMIENSGPIALGADEWLTVAARDNVPRDPLIPTDAADTRSVIFRVKGSDLAAFRAGRRHARRSPQKGRAATRTGGRMDTSQGNPTGTRHRPAVSHQCYVQFRACAPA